MPPPRKLTRGQQIAQTMSTMGFRPDWRGDPGVVEYTKEYAEPDGRLGRLTVVFSKQGVSQVMDSAKLMQFIVTVQGRVDPVIDSIKDHAPRVMQGDMLEALGALEGVREEIDPVNATCDTCGVLLEEWTVDNEGKIICIRPDLCPNN